MRRSDDFEPELLARITHPGRVRTPRRRRRVGAWWWQVPLIACFAALLAGAWWLRPGGHDAALVNLSRATAVAIQSGSWAGLGEDAVRAEDRERLRELLADLTEPLEGADVRLAGAIPIAFGGARARVSHHASPPGGVWASVGNLYLDAGGSLVAIEFGARRDKTTYRLTDFWNAEVVGPASLATAESHAKAAYREFLEQDAAPGVGASLRSTQFVFLSLR